MKIDFVSDVVCPWCAIGLGGLLQALDKLGPDIPVELHVRPFELNPQMPVEGESIDEHLARKYGLSPEQGAKNREAIRARGATVGVTFGMDARSRIYNTFDAHRLLHWAGTLGAAPQLALKQALLQAYFGEGRNPSDPDVLRACAASAGLDAAQADAVIADADRYASEVREEEAFYTLNGIHAVPSVIVDDRHLIQGGQPPEVYEQMLRQLAAAPGAA
jgi:predicted DsbA family dithiol-disulfide isomerase